MECPRRWTFVAITIYLSFQDKALCQSNNGAIRENRECTKLGLPSSSDMLNSVLATAATNGVLPDLIPMLQGQPIVEKLHKCPYPPEMLVKPLSVVPMPVGTNAQEPIILSTQPIRRPTANQNILVATPLSCGSGSPSTMIAQASPLENYPVCAPNVGAARPTPIVLQPQSKCNEVNAYNFYNQISEPISQPEVTTNLPPLPATQIFSSINTCSGITELTPNAGVPCLGQTLVFTNDAQPTPLQILPTASVGTPRVTVVSASPSNSPLSIPLQCCPDYPGNSPLFQYPPQPPIVIGGSSKSSWQNLLPIMLMALLNDRGCGDGCGCGCCRCCCSCNCGSVNNIPIPYPIPIPINNPVINTYSSRNRDNRDDENDDDDWKTR